MRKVLLLMLLVALILAINLAADPASPPVDKKPGMPEHFETYGKEKSQQFFSWCVQAGENRFTKQSIEQYCTCHVYIMEEVIPFPELEKLSKDARTELFQEITKGCAQLGIKPVPATKKPDVPKFKPGQEDKSFWI